MPLICVSGLCTMTDFSTWWTLLTQGNIMGAVLSSYTTTMDIWFYYLILFLAMFMIYIKTQNFGSTIIIGILILAGFLPFASTFSTFVTALGLVYAMIILAFAGILYKIFKG